MHTSMRRRSAEICLILGFILSFIRHVSTLSITVIDLECVSENILSEGDTISGNFVVMDHELFWPTDHPGIDLTVTSPMGNVVHSLKGTSGDKFEFKAPNSGIYQFCFRNPASTPETVSFYIHVGHIPTGQDVAKNEHLSSVNVKIAQLREAMASVITEQKYLKARESQHRYTNESTRKRVIFYTVTEYFMLAGASALQVVYIRRLFSTSLGYNRV